MIQVIELDRGVHLTGKGQAIETIMANEVGTKIFRIYEPGSRFSPPTYSRSFIRKDILHLIRRIKDWYKYEGYQLGSADSEIHCKDRNWKTSTGVHGQRAKLRKPISFKGSTPVPGLKKPTIKKIF